VNNVVAIVNSTAEYHQFLDRRRTNVRFKGGLIGYNAKMTTEYVDRDTDITWVGEHDRKLTQDEMRIAAKLYTALLDQYHIDLPSKRVTFNARGFPDKPLEIP
jgi:hypothetical protein